MQSLDALPVPDDGRFRNPPVVLGPAVYRASDLAEIVDWGLVTNQIPAAHKLAKGEGIKICVADTGRSDHPDLPDPIFSYNFTNSPTDEDRQGHSTHCAGILGARENGVGVRGVAPLCEIGYVKVLGDDGSGDGRGIARGVHKAIDHKVDVLSMSLGGGFDQMIAEAVKAAVDAGIIVICAAGNEGFRRGRNTVGYPARLGFVASIASYNRDGRLSEFSSQGPEVDAAFPGEDILSCWPGGFYRKLSGTSMATPYAAGLAALTIAYERKNAVANALRSTADFKARVRSTAKDQGPVGHDNGWGWGIPDTDGFIRAGGPAATPPSPPAPPVGGSPRPGTVISLGLGIAAEVGLTISDGRTGIFIFGKQ